ncbi:metallophosphoesterase family protein [Phaeovulum sp. W22_SRMD_FR3]|uniref:metallophosphoesterase family protein n=1 Tax=Phaeovulum sp. W22_SRMD_FR3 TaxID=3240274 RepID=UPI003F99C868
MRTLAVLADIHGNADALRAVLADMAAQGVTDCVNLGDCFSGPLAAAETWEILRDWPMPTVRGNHDRYLLEQDRAVMGPSDAVARDELPPEALDWLATLPPVCEVGGLYLCHATPRADDRYWMEAVTAGGAVVLRGAAAIAREAAGIAAPVLLCGHSHLPRLMRLPGGQMLLNPGSVGCPAYEDSTPVPHLVETGAPEARYALLQEAPEGWRARFRAVAYDPARMIARAERQGRMDWARALACGRVA